MVRDIVKGKKIRNDESFSYGNFDGNPINLRRNVSDALVEHRVLKYEQKSIAEAEAEAEAATQSSSNTKKKTTHRRKK